MSKRLVVNADDFGFTHDVNAGIIEAHRNGILTAATLMANGTAFEDAVRLAGENPALDIGCHIVLVQGESVLEPGQPLPASLGELLTAVARGRLRIYEEVSAQVERILAAGIHPTHLDTHKHTHVLPQVLDAVARVGEEYGIRWIRRPFDLPAAGDSTAVPWTQRAVSRGLSLLRPHFHDVLSRHRCRSTDHFAGFQITGRFREAELEALIRSLPPGITEFMCHPGRCTVELRSARTRLKESREDELAALTAPVARRALAESGVELVTYRDLDRTGSA